MATRTRGTGVASFLDVSMRAVAPWENLAMRANAPMRGMIVVLFAALVGCAQNPIALQNQVGRLQQDHLTLAQRNQELQHRADAIDKDNQELESLLAQARQQVRIREDETSALRDQLGSTTSQLAKANEEREQFQHKAKTLTASARRRSGVTITANSSLNENLPVVDVPGVRVRMDGDVVRIELPGDKLFVSGSGQLLPGATTIIERAAIEIYRTYPGQLIGVEGHTDSDQIRTSRWANNHQLSTARATAVFEHLTTRTRLRSDQIFVVGHGPNHPVVSNATPSGKERNRRVELVIYPEQVPRR